MLRGIRGLEASEARKGVFQSSIARSPAPHMKIIFAGYCYSYLHLAAEAHDFVGRGVGTEASRPKLKLEMPSGDCNAATPAGVRCVADCGCAGAGEA